MLNEIPLHKILFLDIETVPVAQHFSDLSEAKQKLWLAKTKYIDRGNLSEEEFYQQRAGIMAEFAKTVCLSVGIITNDYKLRTHSFYGEDEAEILNEFAQMLRQNYFKGEVLLCAHNGKEFDFPFLARRYVINQIEVPDILKLHGKKPWEVPHLDTMELWKFGDYKHYTSLELLAEILDIPTPKTDMDGSQVAKVYYEDKDLERIKNYCERDVYTVAQVFKKFRMENDLVWEKE